MVSCYSGPVVSPGVGTVIIKVQQLDSIMELTLNHVRHIPTSLVNLLLGKKLLQASGSIELDRLLMSGEEFCLLDQEGFLRQVHDYPSDADTSYALTASTLRT